MAGEGRVTAAARDTPPPRSPPLPPPHPAELFGERPSSSHEFVSFVQELVGSGSVSGLQSFPFRFPKVDLPHDSYDGVNGRVRYLLRATVARTPTSAHATKDLTIAGHTPEDGAALAAHIDAAVKLEVGIEDWCVVRAAPRVFCAPYPHLTPPLAPPAPQLAQ